MSNNLLIKVVINYYNQIAHLQSLSHVTVNLKCIVVEIMPTVEGVGVGILFDFDPWFHDMILQFQFSQVTHVLCLLNCTMKHNRQLS